MYISIQDFGQHSMEFVDVINVDTSRRFVLRPFHGSYVTHVTERDEQIFCLASPLYDRERKDCSTQLAVFDSTTGKEIRRSVLPFQANTIAHLPKNNLLAIQFGDRDICFLTAETLEIVWRTEPLFAPELKKKWWFGWSVVAQEYNAISPETRPYPSGCCYVGGCLFEDADGKIWGLASSTLGGKKTQEIRGLSAGVFSFDVVSKKQFFHPMEFSAWGAPTFMAPSPDGRKVVRASPQRHIGSVFDAGHDPSKYVWMIEHQSLDLWSVADQKPISRLHVSDMPFSASTGLHGEHTETHLRNLAKWSNRSKDQFRMPLDIPSGAEDLNEGYNAVRELDKNAWKRVHWEEDSQAMWVWTRHSLRRISVEGSRGPLLIFDRYLNDEHRSILQKRPPGTDIGVGETYPAVQMPMIKTLRTRQTDVEIHLGGDIIRFPKSLATSDAPMLLLTDDMIAVSHIPKLTAKDIADQIPGLVRIKSWKKADVASGLNILAETLRRDISSLMSQGISLVFQVRSSFLDEKQFIQKLSEKDIDVVAETKELIDAWSVAVRQQSLLFFGNEEGAGPLSYFLEYLAAHDDTCSNQLRNYCLLRDGEHESYSRDTVLRSYLDRLGLVRSDLWQLEVLYSLLLGRDGRFIVGDGQQVSNWIHSGLLGIAREALEPQDFAHFVLEELAELEKQPDIFAAFGTHAEAATNAKNDLLSQLNNSSWDKELRVGLLA